MQTVGIVSLDGGLLWMNHHGLDMGVAHCVCGDKHRCPLHGNYYDQRVVLRRRRRRPYQHEFQQMYYEEDDWDGVRYHDHHMWRTDFCCAWDEFCEMNPVMRYMRRILDTGRHIQRQIHGLFHYEPRYFHRAMPQLAMLPQWFVGNVGGRMGMRLGREMEMFLGDYAGDGWDGWGGDPGMLGWRGGWRDGMW